MFAPIYIGLPLGALAAIRVDMRAGRRRVLLLLASIVVSDSAQYYTGRAFGRRPLAPAISPKKTVEGAIGGMVFGTAGDGGRRALRVHGADSWMLALLGAAISLLGIVGDLFESLLKRSAGVKDSSNLIPGHGGVLDRIDSWLFAAPVYYMFVRFVAGRMKRHRILGSTGSIGQSALAVVDAHPERLRVVGAGGRRERRASRGAASAPNDRDAARLALPTLRGATPSAGSATRAGPRD